MKKLFILAILRFSIGLSAQNFNYTVSTDSVAWQELNSQTILNSGNSAWHFSYKIPIGFHFTYLGRQFDSLTIETNGYLVFDADRNFAFTAFNGFGDVVNSSNDHSVLGYEMSGSSGNHILKLQLKNISEGNAQMVMSCQVWLLENNNTLEFHMGPTDYRLVAQTSITTIEDSAGTHDSTIVTLVTDTSRMYRIGLLNMNMDGTENGFFIGGNSGSPSSAKIDVVHPEAIYLTTAPAEGRRYVFTPPVN